MGTALAWLPAMVLSHSVGGVFVSKILSRPFSQLIRPVLAITLVSAVSAFTAMVISNLLPGIVGLVIANLLAVLMIGGLLWLIDRHFALGLLDNLGQIFPQLAVRLGYTPIEQVNV